LNISEHFSAFQKNASKCFQACYQEIVEERELFFLGGNMVFVRFYVLVLRIAVALALLGELKSCTLVMMGKAAEKHELMSDSKYTKMLLNR
jgi:hypothetical protein